MTHCGVILSNLRLAAGEASARAAGSGAPGPLAAQVAAAADQLDRCLTAGAAGAAPDPAGASLSLEPTFAAAQRVVAVLEQLQALPEQQQAAQLALARAAAGRCCAYLRCANLQAEGGPAAGQAIGSKRCRWERSAAIWRGAWGAACQAGQLGSGLIQYCLPASEADQPLGLLSPRPSAGLALKRCTL